MSVIYMRHERHGNKVAISEMEAVADESNGWERYSVPSGTVTVTPTPEEPHVSTLDDLSGAELAKLYEEKFGKRPHHRKTDATIRGEIAAMGPFKDRA